MAWQQLQQPADYASLPGVWSLADVCSLSGIRFNHEATVDCIVQKLSGLIGM